MSSTNSKRKAKQQRERENKAIIRGAQVIKYREKTASKGHVVDKRLQKKRGVESDGDKLSKKETKRRRSDKK